jgi:hypothetical protein
MTTYYKTLGNGQKSYHGGNVIWIPGEWRTVDGPIKPRKNGLHFTTIDNLFAWPAPECWIFEDGSPDETITDGEKLVTRRGRIVERVSGWNPTSLRLFAADCAEQVLPIFEKHHPGDDRPRKAIEAARAFAHGETSAAAAAWAAASDAASDAAAAAAWAASSAAASGAAWADASDAASAAYSAATWAATRAASRAASDAAKYWQLKRLQQYLDGSAA